MKKLIVAETFYSIQGEGITMGIPSVFLRLGGCNLLCKSKEWTCDTIEVWKKGVATAFIDVLSEEYIQRIREGAHLVITGGEPLMQQETLEEYIKYLANELHLFPYIEIETNGTITPSFFMALKISLWNVSPKLSNSGETAERRINDSAIFVLKDLASIFKFVISKKDDILEICQDYPLVTSTKIILMPAGDTQELLAQTRPMVAEACKGMNFRYSDRLHVVIWNQKTGV